ncbi:hypothetical protein D3C81_1263150 [compost metagenome]
MNRAEPLVARDDATTALVFDVFKECAHDGGRYVEHRQMVDCHRGSSTDKWKQEGQRVAVTDLGVVGKVALGDQILQQEATYPCPEAIAVNHDQSPGLSKWQTGDSLRATVRESYADSAGSTLCRHAPDTLPIAAIAAAHPYRRDTIPVHDERRLYAADHGDAEAVARQLGEQYLPPNERVGTGL